MSLNEFVVFLASSAGASAALSFIAERLPAFQKLTSQQKSAIMLFGSLAIALSAYGVLTYVPPETLDALQPIFQVIYGVVATWLANQFAHKADPANEPEVEVVIEKG